jgi:non-specific serine/threonine protein kinase
MHLTKSGITLGTVAYMSPEQARGEPVDHRTDIWSFGVVLYEMLTGQLPFRGEYEAATMYAILNEEPKSLAELRNGVPTQLRQIVNKALQKNADLRYQNAPELLEDLQRLRLAESGASVQQVAKRKFSRSLKLAVGVVFLIFAAAVIFFRQSIQPQKAKTFIIAIAPFWGANSAAADEGKTMQVLVEREVRALLGQEQEIKILGKEIEHLPRSHEEARALGNKLNAALVIWGEVVVLRNEVEIQPYLTIIDEHEKPFEQTPQSLLAKLSEPRQLSLRKAKATEIGDLALLSAGRYYRNKDSEKALAFFQRITPPSVESLALQAWVYQEKQNWLQSEKLFEKAIELNPKNPQMYQLLLGLGQAYALQHKYAQALLAYNKAEELAPDRWEAYLLRGQVYYRQGLYEKAIEEYTLASNRDPNNSWPHSELAQAYRDAGKYEQAIAEYQQAINLDPESAYRYRLGIASVFAQQGKIDEAIAEYKSASELTSADEHVHLELAKLYEKPGRYQEALKEYNAAIKIAPDKTWPYISLGEFYLRQGQYGKAKELFLQLMEMQPDDPAPHSNLAVLYMQEGDSGKAILEYQRAIAAKPDDALLDAITYVNLGHLYTQKGQYEEALSSFSKAVELVPQEYWTHSQLGRFYSQRNEYRAAQEELSKALELNPNHTESCALLDTLLQKTSGKRK